MRQRALHLFYLLLLAALPPELSAQEPPPEPASSTLILDDVHWRSYRYVGDILAQIPGVWIRDVSETGNWSTASLWGGDPAQVQVLIDGRPLREPWTGSADLSLIPVEIIRRIDIYTGLNPFGSAPAGGAINIVTLDVPSNLPYSRIVYRSVRGRFSDTDITFGQKVSENTEFMTGLLLKKYGDFDAEYRSYEGQIIRAKIKTRLFSKIDFMYSLLHHKSHLDPPYSQTLPVSAISIASPHRYRIRYDHSVVGAWDLWGTRARLRLDHTPSEIEIKNRNTGDGNSYRVRCTAIEFRHSLRLRKMRLIWGGEARFHGIRSDSLSHREAAFQAYIRNGIDFAKTLSNTLQIHWNASPGGASRILIRDRLGWSPGRRLHVWTAYAEGVRNPSLGERFGLPFYPALPLYAHQLSVRERAGISANEGLHPEFSRTGEMGLRWSPSEKFYAQIRAFLKTVTGLIQPLESGETFRFENTGSFDFRGADVSLTLGPWLGFRSSISLNAMKSVDTGGGSLLERPSFWTNAALGWRHSFFRGDLDITLSAGIRHHTGYWTLTGETADQASLYWSDPGPVFYAKAYIMVIENVHFTLAFDNILDAPVLDSGMLPGQGRTFRVGIAWNLYE